MTDEVVQAASAFALMELVFGNRANQHGVFDNGGVGQLAVLMKHSKNGAVQAEVAGALWALSDDEDMKTAIAGAQTVPPLVTLQTWRPRKVMRPRPVR